MRMKKLMIVLALAVPVSIGACSKSKPATTTAKQPDAKMEGAGTGGDTAKKPDGDMKPEGDKKPDGGGDPCAAPK
jgi:hypothetical protein